MNGTTTSLFTQRVSRHTTADQIDGPAPIPDSAATEPSPVSVPTGTLQFPQSLSENHTPQHAKERDADDKIIAAWFKLMKPDADKNSGLFKNDHKMDDPGRVPDPLYEPTKATVPDSLKIITFNDLMRAFAPKKPHWKHYDDVSNQFQVGSQERD